MNKMLSVAIAISVAIVIIAVSISDPTTDVQPNEPTSKYVEQVSDRNKQEPLTINPHYCGSGEANSNKYITEYVLPNNCSLPIGIAIDEYGKVWIGESNERKLAVFDPDNESLQEFDIPGNTEDAKGSGIWSIIFGEDKSVWFSDVSTNSIWMFQIEEQKFLKYEIPTPESFPFDLTIDEDEKIWFTELFGKKFGYIDPVTNQIIELEPPLQPSTIGAITVDENNNIWLVMNNPTGSFVLKYEQESEIYSSYKLPDEVTAPVGISIDKSGNVWIADHAGSMFFKINPLNNITKAYVTSLPPVRTSINTGGLPSSYPYWIVIDTNDRIWINEHQGNAIAVFDPNEETLIEY
ncbi:MAG: hypothetical protein EX285_06520, partial [Thaumarchaeota archaeon]|nr:hypothetical protein [Nitrososphaerota archaeon]